MVKSWVVQKLIRNRRNSEKCKLICSRLRKLRCTTLWKHAQLCSRPAYDKHKQQSTPTQTKQHTPQPHMQPIRAPSSAVTCCRRGVGAESRRRGSVLLSTHGSGPQRPPRRLTPPVPSAQLSGVDSSPFRRIWERRPRSFTRHGGAADGRLAHCSGTRGSPAISQPPASSSLDAAAPLWLPDAIPRPGNIKDDPVSVPRNNGAPQDVS